MANIVLAGVAALIFGFFVFIGTAEYYEQQSLRASCEAVRGHYYKIGDRRWNGLCVKPDGILWDRTK